MSIIDTHVHVFPEKIASAAVAATLKFYADAVTDEMHAPTEFPSCAGTLDDYLQRAAGAGIGRAMIFSTATTPRQVESINTFIASCCKANPALIGVGTMHPDYPYLSAEVARMKALGLKGVKLHPEIQGFRLDDDRILPLCGLLEDSGMFLIAHTGDYRYGLSSPDRMARLANLFPGMRFIAAHFGCWSQWGMARELLRLPNLYMDTSSTLGFACRQAAEAAFEVFDPTHIFFGSDYPMWDPAQELERFRSLGLSEELSAMVLGDNFEKFLAEIE